MSTDTPIAAIARTASYPSLSSFYLADRRRIPSREVDVGLLWREGEAGAVHRAAWIRDTGELYLVRLGDPQDGGGTVELLATVADEQRLQHELDGWRAECGRRDSLKWLRARVGDGPQQRMAAARRGVRPGPRGRRAHRRALTGVC